jgi:hypothetical protein
LPARTPAAIVKGFSAFAAIDVPSPAAVAGAAFPTMRV